MFVCCECCVLSGRGLCDGLITCQEESYRLWRVVVHDQEASRMRTLYVLCGSQSKQRSFLYNINWLVFIDETECVYCAVRTWSLNIISLLFVFKCFLNAKRSSWFSQMTQYMKLAPLIDSVSMRHVLLTQTKKAMIDCVILFCSYARPIGRLLCQTNQTGHLFKLGYSSQLSLRLLKSLLKQTQDIFMLLFLSNKWFVLSYCLFLCNLFDFFLFALHTYLHVDFSLHAFPPAIL
jgi:hypothetical protein